MQPVGCIMAWFCELLGSPPVVRSRVGGAGGGAGEGGEYFAAVRGDGAELGEAECVFAVSASHGVGAEVEEYIEYEDYGKGSGIRGWESAADWVEDMEY